MMIRLAGLLLAVLFAAPGCASAQDAAPSPVFKGSWAGPPAHAPAKAAAAHPHLPPPVPPGIRSPVPKHVLVLGGARGWHHDSIPSAMAAVFNWSRATRLWEAEMRSDFSLVNAGGGQRMFAGFRPEGLRDFDAIVVASATGDWGAR